MKKKILFLVAAFALFVPSVLAAEPTLEDKNFFANGTSITVTDRTDGVEGALIKWEGGEQLVPATINIFGGSHNSDEKITTTNITIEGGTMHNVFGGGLHKSSVGTATVTVNGGKFTGLVHGGGASSLSGTTCHTWYEGTDKTQATTVVENATLIINGGEFSSKSDAFGGGEGKSYTKKATLLINDTFTGDIRYVTGGGSNGWTDEVNVRLLGGKVKVLQAVNRGFTLNSEMTVDGATVENAYASAEGDNLELGVTESAVLDIVSGKVTNVAPGQSGNPNETAKDIAELSYVEGTVTNGTDSFADKNITVNVRLTLTSDNIKETISVPKGTKFTDEEITRYYKPYSLKVFINGKEVYTTIMNQQVQQTALYSYSEEDYTMPISALGEIEEIQITYNKYSTPLELTFKDKTYKIGGSTVDLENSTIPTYVEVQTLKQIIGAKLEFNYKEQTLNIVVK